MKTFLQSVSQDARQKGQRTKAASLLAQAKTEFGTGVAIDPMSVGGQKAAEMLETL